MRFDLITIFPQILNSYFKESILGRAVKEKKVIINSHNLRDWTQDKHKVVDDLPFGGGAGMVMKVEPIYAAVKDLKQPRKKTKVVVLSAAGQLFNQEKAREYAKLDQLILIAGRYEGIDQRIIDHVADEEISVGPYVLTGGELPAATIIDAVTRLLPGVLKNADSLKEESHSQKGVGEYPQYTRPPKFKNWPVPPVLLSGDHAKIQEWRKRKQRPLSPEK